MATDFASIEAVGSFIAEFEACRLPKSRWTHSAHLVVGWWGLNRLGRGEALDWVRDHIRRHNESVGTPNSDREGYHETITRAYLIGIEQHVAAMPAGDFMTALNSLLGSPLAQSSWPLRFYSRERLFSVEARRGWLEPDLGPFIVQS